jgi:hypothetical protein
VRLLSWVLSGPRWLSSEKHSNQSEAVARPWRCPDRTPNVCYFWVQTSCSHTVSHRQSHVGAPIMGSSTPHRRHPFVTTWPATGLLKQAIAPYPDEGE